jgi:hypothetical protein
MAVKRAMVNMTRVVTACSDIFDQDVEDLPSELLQAGRGETPAAAAAKKKVQRASEQSGGTSAGATPANNGLVTEPRTVKDVRVFGQRKDNYALVLHGDPEEYTTKDAKLARELEQFKGTDHKIRVRYEDNDWNGKTYHNIKTFAIADAPTPTAAATPPPAAVADGELKAAEIPFGGTA